MDKKRTIMPNGMYTDDELNLFKSVFAEDDELIKIVRKVMLNLDLPEREEIRWRKTFKGNKPLNDLMRKMFLPTLDGDSPFQLGHQSMIDLWMTIDINGKTKEEATSLINARSMTIEYLDTMIDYLNNKSDKKKSIYDFDVKDIDQFRARNELIGHIETQVATIFGLAGFKSETPEETLKRLSQDSSK